MTRDSLSLAVGRENMKKIDKEQRKKETQEKERLRKKKKTVKLISFLFMMNNLKMNKILTQRRNIFTSL